MKTTFSKRLICAITLVAFVCTSVAPSFAQSAIQLPVVGVMVQPSATFVPAILKGMKVYPKEPLRFDFVVDTGNSGLKGEALEPEVIKIVRYFLAALTTPEKDLWVNLSPYEGDRIIIESFGETEMGRDLLAQDYILKQITSSLIYPESESGKAFWAQVYKKTYDKYGTTDIPVDTFNKVWITPDEATVYVNGNTAVIKSSHLKVMLESDYVAANQRAERIGGEVPGPVSPAFAMQKSTVNGQRSTVDGGRMTVDPVQSEAQELAKSVLREIVIPILEKEVNDGENFAKLRQIYHAMVLATWFKRNLKETLVGQVYTDQGKVKGIDLVEKDVKDQIWHQYVEAFKTGVFNYIKEETEEMSGELIPRKYFSGGFSPNGDAAQIVNVSTTDMAEVVSHPTGEDAVVAVNLQQAGQAQSAANGSDVADLKVSLSVVNAEVLLQTTGMTSAEVNRQMREIYASAVGESLTSEAGERRVQETQALIENGQLTVALDGGKIAGYIIHIIEEKRHRGYVQMMAVHRDFQQGKKGVTVGRTLMNAAGTWFRKQGMATVLIEPEYGSGGFYNKYFGVQDFKNQSGSDVGRRIVNVSDWPADAEISISRAADRVDADRRFRGISGLIRSTVIGVLLAVGGVGASAAEEPLFLKIDGPKVSIGPVQNMKGQEVLLKARLQNADPIERLAALEDLHAPVDVLGNVDVVLGLAKSDPNSSVRLLAFKVLRGIGKRAPHMLADFQGDVVSAGLAGLADADVLISGAAAQFLGYAAPKGDQRVVDALSGLASNKDLGVSVLEALGRMGHGNPKALATLIGSISDENAEALHDVFNGYELNGVDSEPGMRLLYDRVMVGLGSPSLGVVKTAMLRFGKKSSYTTRIVSHVLGKEHQKLGKAVDEWMMALIDLEYPDRQSRETAKNILNDFVAKNGKGDWDWSLQRVLSILNGPEQGYQADTVAAVYSVSEIQSLGELVTTNANLVVHRRERLMIPYGSTARSVDSTPERLAFPSFQAFRYGGVRAFAYLDRFEQRNAQDRIAIFVEDAEHHGKILSEVRMRHLYGERDKEWLYDGHNYSSETLAVFFNKARAENIRLMPAEVVFRDGLIRAGVLSEVGGRYVGVEGVAYISYTLDQDIKTRQKVLRHELSHALYFSNPDYRREVEKRWKDLAPEQKDFVKTFLRVKGYNIDRDQNLLMTEYAAYFQDGTSAMDIISDLVNGTIGNQYSPELEKLREMYSLDENGAIFQGKMTLKMVGGAIGFLQDQDQSLGDLLGKFMSGAYYNKNVEGPSWSGMSEKRELGSGEINRDIGGLPFLVSRTTLYRETMTMRALNGMVLNDTKNGFESSGIKRRVLGAVRASFGQGEAVDQKNVEIRRTAQTTVMIERDGQGRAPVSEEKVDELVKPFEATALDHGRGAREIVLRFADNPQGYQLDVQDADPDYDQRMRQASIDRQERAVTENHKDLSDQILERIAKQKNGDGPFINNFIGDPEKVSALKQYLDRTELLDEHPLVMRLASNVRRDSIIKPADTQADQKYLKVPNSQGKAREMADVIEKKADYKGKAVSSWSKEELVNFLFDNRADLPRALGTIGAGLDKAQGRDLGGIDLNSKNLNLSETGGKIDFTQAEDVQVLSGQVEGFIPVVLGITLLTDPQAFFAPSSGVGR